MDKIDKEKEETSPLKALCWQAGGLLFIFVLAFLVIPMLNIPLDKKAEEQKKEKVLTIGEKSLIIQHSDWEGIDCQVNGNFVNCYLIANKSKTDK